jgi:hypothetical protein
MEAQRGYVLREILEFTVHSFPQATLRVFTDITDFALYELGRSINSPILFNLQTLFSAFLDEPKAHHQVAGFAACRPYHRYYLIGVVAKCG